MTVLRLATISLLFLFGCNSSPVPIGPPESAPMNEDLIGIWEPIIPEDEQTDDDIEILMILQFNEHEYYVEMWENSESPWEEIYRLRGFLTPVAGTSFANLQSIELEDEDEDYYIYHVELSEEDILSITLIDENELKKMKSSEELRGFIENLVETNAIDTSEIISFRRKMDTSD